ncbi:MAG: ketopantoate reductase C-terminal domain-containing protein, partial [Hyphomicrobiales bacterium]
MKAKLVRTGKPMPLNAPQFFFARDRSIAEEAFAGDIVGLPNHGTLRIGDTLTEGEDVVFKGVPSFAPEILRRVKLKDAMKAKKLREALQQMAEEGVVQIFLPHDGAPAIVGVVGALQLDVLKERMDVEYSLPVDFEPCQYAIARWVSSEDKAALQKFVSSKPSSMADDLAAGCPTEIDDLCGAVIRLAAAHGREAPLNAAMVRLVDAARPGTRMSGPELLAALCAA